MLLLDSSDRAASSVIEINRKRHVDAALLLFVLLGTISMPCRAHSQRILCDNGFSDFSSEFRTGVTVAVGASKSGGFASHACDATLRWKTNALPVVRDASQVDIDVLGADLGLGAPMVAFQIKKSDLQILMTYKIYSLDKPPRLLRTITGGDYYDAQDYDLEGRIAIWTNDAGAMNGFENLPLSSFDFPPSVVLRFEKKRLVDVSSEYQSYYDHQIAEVEAQLSARALSEFRKSDGQLSSLSDATMENLHTLLRTKIGVLEVVWAYLYSGRSQQAWTALASMWPPGDMERIRAAIENARARGILRQVDYVEKPSPHARRRHHAVVYDMAYQTRSVVNVSMMNGQMPNVNSSGDLVQNPNPSMVPPQPIYLAFPPPQNTSQVLPVSQIYLDLLVDAAGKVRSAKLINKADQGPIGEALIRASANWNFIPGTYDGRAVPCRIRLGISPLQ